MIPQLPALILALGFTVLPLVQAGLFPKKSNVKHIGPKEFREALKEERTFMTAFVAPWCGHCQKLAPELLRAADGLHPLVPVYAVDCDDGKNKALCAEEGVKGFPTIKLYPEGRKVPPLEFDGTRTASSLFYWSSRAVPAKISRSQTAKGVADIVRKNPGKPKAILMNKSNKTPLLWRVMSQKYGDKVVFGNCRDRKGKVSVEMGFEAGHSKTKVFIYGPKDTEPILYEGIMKFSALSEFFDQILDGSVDISRASLNAKQEILKVPEEERDSLDDETKIGDAGYGGFNPHEGVDMEELMKLGGNPHAHGHPGAANPHGAHGAYKSTSKKPSVSAASKTPASSAASGKFDASSKATASSVAGSATHIKTEGLSSLVENTNTPVEAAKKTDKSGHITSSTVEAAQVTDHSKDEL